MRDWYVRVEWTGADELTTDQADTLHEQLAPYHAASGQEDRPGILSAQLAVEAGTIRQAFDTAVRAVEAACKTAGVRCTVEAVDLCTEAEFERRQAEPVVPPLAGIKEVSEMLGVSRQRAGQIVQEHAAALPEVARLGSGPVYLAKTVERFGATWERKRTGRPRKTAAS